MLFLKYCCPALTLCLFPARRIRFAIVSSQKLRRSLRAPASHCPYLFPRPPLLPLLPCFPRKHPLNLLHRDHPLIAKPTMSPTHSPFESGREEVPAHAFDDAEKGLYENTRALPVTQHVEQVEEIGKPGDTILPATSLIHEGITPSSSAPVLPLSLPQSCNALDPPTNSPALPKANRPKRRVSRWIIFNLWFNTYRKFFTFVTLLNLTGIILAALDRFPYAKDHLGALVLGNLLCAVLFRNELFLRCLYTVAIYGLRSVRLSFVYYSSGD